MASFKNISIKNKLILIQVATAFIAALICSAFFLYNDIKIIKSSEIKNKNSIAEIVGVNLISPILFNDRDAANKILLHLIANPTILNAALFDKNGKEFAGYIKKGVEPFSFPIFDSKPLVKESFFESEYVVSYQIFHEEEFLGIVMLHAELRDLTVTIYNYFKIALLILIVSIFSAFIISNFLQKIISNRLLSLVRSTKEVSETGNYSIRISAQGNDEIGVLSEGFNSMLEQIEKTAKKLELSLSLMRATIESTADGILVVDNAKKISVVNQRFVEMMKIPEAILATKDDNKALDYVLRQIKAPEKFLSKVKELYANPELESYDVFEMKDGTIFERYSVPQRSQVGEIIGRVWSFRDVTIRNRAVEDLEKLNEQLEERVKERTADLTKIQESLQLSEEKYRKLVEEAGDVVYTSDYNGYFTYINPMSIKLTGYTEHELVGKHFLEIIDPEWKERVAKFYKDQFDNRIQETLFSFPIITKSGEKKWIEQTVIQQKIGDRIMGHQAIVRDITERKKNEEEIKQKSEELERSNKNLKDSEQQIQSIFNSAPDAVIVINHESTIVKWNHKAEKLFYWNESEVMGKPLYDFIIPERYRERHKNGMKHYLSSGEGPFINKDVELEAINKKGIEFNISLTIAPVGIKDKILFIGFIRDITQRKKIEEEIKQKSGELERSNQELEQFAYVASHDLQEPLRTINNFVGLLEKNSSTKVDEDTKLYFKFIVNASSKMQDLIKDLLEYSRVGRNMTIASVDCNAIVKEVIALMDASIKESSAKITVASLPVLKGNETELKRLFQNLLSNAVKFRKQNDAPVITITAEDKGTEYLFAITDNGIGIEEQFIPKLFIIFQRLHSEDQYAGTGIGLATCKKIVMLHGGKIWVESKIGEGSTFYFTLSK